MCPTWHGLLPDRSRVEAFPVGRRAVRATGRTAFPSADDGVARHPRGVGRDAPAGRPWSVAWSDAAVVVGCVMLTFAPLIAAGGFVATHEAERYPALLAHFADSFARGHLYPRWMPGLAGGYGYPTFVFYQPLVFFVASVMRLVLGISLGFALVLAVGGLFAGACAAWIRVARILSPSQPAWIAPVIFALTPGLFLNLYVRGDLSEFAATNVAVLVLASFVWLLDRLRASRGVTAPVFVLGGSLAAVVTAHPMTGAATWFVIMCLAVATLVGEPRDGRLAQAGCVTAALVLGATLSAPYWVPFLQLRSLVSLDRAMSGYYDPTIHLVHPMQLLSRQWGFGGSGPGVGDGMSFQLGLPHVVVAVAGCVALRRSPLVCGAGLVWAALVVAMLPVGALLWRSGSPLHAFQFPWRLLSVIAVLQPLFVMGIAFGGSGATPGRTRAGAIAVLVFMLLWYAPMMRTNPEAAAVPFAALERALVQRFEASRQRFDVYALQNEFLPRGVTDPPAAPRGDAAVVACEADGRVIIDPMSSDDDIRAHVTADAPCTIVVRQFLFPGWRVTIDGREVAPETLDASRRPDGLIRLTIAEPGGHAIRAWYAGPPGGGLRCACMLGVVASIATVLHRVDRKRGAAVRAAERRPV